MKLWLNEEGGLAFKGPKNFMTDDLLNQIKERKEEIVECLKRERFIKHDEKGKYLQFPLNDMQSAYYSGMKRIWMMLLHHSPRMPQTTLIYRFSIKL